MTPQQALDRQRQPRLAAGARDHAQQRDLAEHADHYHRILAEWPEIIAAQQRAEAVAA